MRAGCVDGILPSLSSISIHTGIGKIRTYSPDRLVTNSSRPYFPSSADRKTFGTLSRPLSSTRACSWPLNGQTPPEDTTSLQNSPRRMVGEAHVVVNRKIQHVSKLREDLAELWPTELARFDGR